MKKIKKLVLSDVKPMTTSQMKSLVGGYSYNGNSYAYVLGCKGKSVGDHCYYRRDNVVREGRCKYLPFMGLACWGG